jgi:maleylpyruvate isomerase
MTSREADRSADRAIVGARAAHGRLVEHLEALETAGVDLDRLVADPSALPGWTVGHVLTHLARNADSMVRVAEAAAAGLIVDQYEGGMVARSSAIDDGSGRPWSVQVADVRASIDRLHSAWDDCAGRGWAGRWRSALGPECDIAELPFRRWREVEIHHADLGLAGFGVDDWSPDYVACEVDLREADWMRRNPTVDGLPAEALALAPAQRLAWLMGRAVPNGLEPVRFG